MKYRGNRAGKATRSKLLATRKILPIITSRHNLNAQNLNSSNIQFHTSSCLPKDNACSKTMQDLSDIKPKLSLIMLLKTRLARVHSFWNLAKLGWQTLTPAVILYVDGYIFKSFPRQSQRLGGGTGIPFRDSLSVHSLRERKIGLLSFQSGL